MKSSYLLPHSYKRLGLVLFIPGLILGLMVLIADPEPDWLKMKVPSLLYGDLNMSEGSGGFEMFPWIWNNLFNEISALILLSGLVLLVFSREIDEDEFIMKLRLDSMLWAVMIYSLLLFLALLLLYDVSFFQFMMVNMFMLYLLYITRFQIVIYRYRRASNEE